MSKLGIVAIMLATAVAVGCGGRKNNVKTVDYSTVKMEANDTTMYGICGEGTSMNSLELVTDSGDTVVFSIERANEKGLVKGGLSAGDRMAVVPGVGDNQEFTASSVVNITSLLGKWASLDRSFELRANGSVVGDVKEPHPYTSWRMVNGLLVLSADTFDIRSLGPDSLLLNGSKGTVAYRRLAAVSGAGQ